MSNQMVSVDITKLGLGMKSIFTGCAMLFDSLGVSGESMTQMNSLANATQQTTVSKAAPVAETQTTPAKVQQVVTTAAEDFPPADDEPPFDVEETKPVVQISVKDLQKVAAQKITTNRKNSAKIQQLLTTYGCGTMSEIPEEKREAFLNDLAQL